MVSLLVDRGFDHGRVKLKKMVFVSSPLNMPLQGERAKIG
jgi:hypothetical protein